MIRFPVAALTISVCLVVLLFTAGKSFALPKCPGSYDQSRWTNCVGTYTDANGDKYAGEWRDGKYHGHGTYYWLADNEYKGAKYVGEYRDNVRHGQGTFTFSNGYKYAGEWRDNVPNGQGTATHADGTVQEGIFKDGEFQYAQKAPSTVSALPPCPEGRFHNCFGTYTWPDGGKYVGEWMNNTLHGQGTYTFPDGRVTEGIFKDGQFQYASKDSGQNQEQKPAKNSSTSAKSGKDIASSNLGINFFCPPSKEPDKLPKDMAGLESDFGKSASELADIFKNDNQAKIPYILSLKQYSNAFDGPDIKETFNQFLNSRDPRYLALIRERSMKPYSRITWAKKADAMFAYGLVHVYYQNVGGNAAMGNELIKKAARERDFKKGRDVIPHAQYGASYIEGTRRYNGYGKDVNLSIATTHLNVAYESSLKRGDNFAKSVQVEFLRLIAEPNFPEKRVYAYLAKEAASIRQSIEQEFSSSARSANPAILQKTQSLAILRNELLVEIATISGMGKDLEEFKVRAKQLASQANPSNSVVKETIILGDGFAEKIVKRMGALDKLDEDGLIKLEIAHQKNEHLLYAGIELGVGWFSYQAFQMSSGGADFNLFETVEVLKSLDRSTKRMCAVREAIIGFAERTEVTINSATELQIPDEI